MLVISPTRLVHTRAIGDSRDSIQNVVNMENGEIKVENVDTNIKDDIQHKG